MLNTLHFSKIWRSAKSWSVDLPDWNPAWNAERPCHVQQANPIAQLEERLPSLKKVVGLKENFSKQIQTFKIFEVSSRYFAITQ
jgi:hypothetical protein